LRRGSLIACRIEKNEMDPRKYFQRGGKGHKMADTNGHVYAIGEAITNAVLIGLQYLHISPHRKYHGPHYLRGPWERAG
jgi:hypothetical protein